METLLWIVRQQRVSLFQADVNWTDLLRVSLSSPSGGWGDSARQSHLIFPEGKGQCDFFESRWKLTVDIRNPF